jgi:CheY-like chemotaxis protein
MSDSPSEFPASTAEERPIRILLVEDNPADVRLTREMLRESKVRNDLLVAHTAEEAEDILGLPEAGPSEEEAAAEDTGPRPDLVLLDLNLPVKSGHDLLQEIKSHPTLRRIPVVMLSSSEAEEDVVKSYDEHANAYVTKPVDLDEITTIVQSIDEFWFQVVRLPGE